MRHPFARFIGSRALMLVSVPLVTFTYVEERVWTYLLTPARNLVKVTGARALILRYPATGGLLTSAVMTALCLPIVRSRFETLPLGFFIYLLVYWLSAGAHRDACWAMVLSPPADLDAIRAQATARWPERWFARRMSNPIDAIFIRMLIHAAIIMLPPFALLVRAETFGPFSVMYFVMATSVSGLPIELLLHTDIHNRIFQTRHLKHPVDRAVIAGAGLLLHYVLGPIGGRLPEFYGVQHVSVHHAEDNGLLDTQTTLRFDRQSYFEFCSWAIQFMLSFTFAYDVIPYLLKARRRRQLWVLLRGLAVYAVTLLGLAYVCWPVVVLLMVHRLTATQAASMVLVWHAFADPADPKNVYRNSIHVLSEGSGGFGGNPHLEHHLSPGRHWSLLNADSSSHLEQCQQEHALVLSWPALITLLRALWQRDLRLLKDVTDLTWAGVPSFDVLLPVLEARTRPVPDGYFARGPLLDRMDKGVGRFMARYVLKG